MLFIYTLWDTFQDIRTSGNTTFLLDNFLFLSLPKKKKKAETKQFL